MSAFYLCSHVPNGCATSVDQNTSNEFWIFNLQVVSFSAGLNFPLHILW